MRANHAPVDALTGRSRQAPLGVRQRRSRLRVPVRLPDATLNPVSMKVFNWLYYARHPTASRISECDEFFYPLDAVEEWNRAYGRRGVLQYQCVIPEEGARAGLVALLETLTTSGFGSFLTVLKTLGAESKGLLSFPMPGKTLALDVPNTGPDLIEVFHRLDAIVLGLGGRAYLAKDACMTKETFERMYPRHAEFRAARAILDPKSRFSSSLARRVGLAEGPP